MDPNRWTAEVTSSTVRNVNLPIEPIIFLFCFSGKGVKGLGVVFAVVPCGMISFNTWLFKIELQAYIFRMSTIDPFLYWHLVELVQSWVMYMLFQMSHNRSVLKWFGSKVNSDLEATSHMWMGFSASFSSLPYNIVAFSSPSAEYFPQYLDICLQCMSRMLLLANQSWQQSSEHLKISVISHPEYSQREWVVM